LLPTARSFCSVVSAAINQRPHQDRGQAARMGPLVQGLPHAGLIDRTPDCLIGPKRWLSSPERGRVHARPVPPILHQYACARMGSPARHLRTEQWLDDGAPSEMRAKTNHFKPVLEMAVAPLARGLTAASAHFPPWRIRLLSERSCPANKGLRKVSADFVKVGEEIAGAAAREYRCGPLLPLAPAGAAA
jgi:hypothetical protein